MSKNHQHGKKAKGRGSFQREDKEETKKLKSQSSSQYGSRPQKKYIEEDYDEDDEVVQPVVWDEKESRGKYRNLLDLRKEKYHVPVNEGAIMEVPTHKLRTKLQQEKEIAEEGMTEAARAEILLPERPGNIPTVRTFSQEEILSQVDISTAKKKFDLQLDKGPYVFRWSNNARFILLGGIKGHVGLFDWFNNKLLFELNIDETLKDVSFLHNENLVAVAQRDHCYIYDRTGREINRLKNFWNPILLEYLPYHMLLVMIAKSKIQWLDVSLGKSVAEHLVKERILTATQNPTNAVMYLSHNSGHVTLWAPNSKEYLVKIFCGVQPVSHIAIDPKGNYMATAAANNVKIWDLRSSYAPLSTFQVKRVTGLDFSQRGLLATASGHRVKVTNTYLNPDYRPLIAHEFPLGTAINSIKFCPYEDVLGVSTFTGFSTLLVPGAGEANFDTLEANPFSTKTQRRDFTVKRLLDKIPADLISLDPNVVGTVIDNTEEVKKEQERQEFDKKYRGKSFTPKKKMRGRSTSSKMASKKEHARMERKRAMYEEDRIETEDPQKEHKKQRTTNALDRFNKPT